MDASARPPPLLSPCASVALPPSHAAAPSAVSAFYFALLRATSPGGAAPADWRQRRLGFASVVNEDFLSPCPSVALSPSRAVAPSAVSALDFAAAASSSSDVLLRVPFGSDDLGGRPPAFLLRLPPPRGGTIGRGRIGRHGLGTAARRRRERRGVASVVDEDSRRGPSVPAPDDGMLERGRLRSRRPSGGLRRVGEWGRRRRLRSGRPGIELQCIDGDGVGNAGGAAARRTEGKSTTMGEGGPDERVRRRGDGL